MPPLTALAPLLPAAVPLLWLATAAVFAAQGRSDARRFRHTASLSSLLALAATLCCALLLPGRGALLLPAPVNADVLGALLRLDSLGAVMLLLVNFIGAVVLRFACGYLSGDADQGRFLRDLSLTVAAVSLFALAGNAWMLLFAWLATGWAIERLLLFRRRRPGARIAARKMRVVARCADAALALALLSLSISAGSADLSAIVDRVAVSDPGSYSGPALLLVFAAALKSAQFPAHGWLTEVMEAPTPVSALLHAGVVNAGGFLLLRCAGVLNANPSALYLLMLIGGTTALFASLVMLTQRSVKVALAWSTVAQMGFMLLQCGLGAYSSAMLHIVAHSLYKAHAFLSSSSIVDLVRGSASRPRNGPPGALLIAGSVAIAVAVLLGLRAILDVAIADEPAILGLAAVLLLALVHLVLQSAREEPSLRLLLRVAVNALMVSCLYLLLQAAARRVLGTDLPALDSLDPVQIGLLVLLLIGFAASSVLQWALPAVQRSRRGRALWVHLSNGLYINLLLDRLLNARRVDAAGR